MAPCGFRRGPLFIGLIKPYCLFKSDRQFGEEHLTVCDLCLHLQAAAWLLLDFREGNRQVQYIIRRDNRDILHVLCLIETEFAMQKHLQQFLDHLHDADTGRDGMSRKMRLVDRPFGIQSHMKDVESFFLLLRNNRKKVIL